MSKIIEYGKPQKVLSPFFGDSNIIQQFSIQKSNLLQKIFLYVHLNDNCNHDYLIKIIIVDQQENVYFTKQLNMGDVFQSDYIQILTDVKLNADKNYFLCLDSYGSGSDNNNVSFCIGYRKKMMNFFINNKFSLGQLCFKLKVK